jgi:hypothetical protein
MTISAGFWTGVLQRDGLAVPNIHIWSTWQSQPSLPQDILQFAEYLDRVSDSRRQISDVQSELQLRSVGIRNRIGPKVCLPI